MQTVQILIEENAYGAVRPMEVVATAPVAALVPAIVEELKLPQADLFGNKLVYVLRHHSGGPIIPEYKSLEASGVNPGTKLSLDSYVVDGSVATLFKSEPVQAPHSFYSSQTMTDVQSFPELGKDTSASLPVVGHKKKSRRWTRRALLVAGGAALGAGGLGLGYAAYRSMMTNSTMLTTMMHAPAKNVPTTSAVTQQVVPTKATSVFVFSQHQQSVRALTWSPDGKMLASGANDTQLLIWDLQGNVLVRKEQDGAVRSVAWSPDGKQLALGAAKQLQIINPWNGALIAQPAQMHTDAITTLAWSSRQPSMLVSGGLDKKAIVWNTISYTPQTIFTAHTTAIESATWAPDNVTIATSSHGGVVRVWNAESGQQVHGFFMDAQIPMRAVSFASAGPQLAVGGDDGLVRLWNGLMCQNGSGTQCLDAPQRLHAHQGHVRTLAWSPDARFLATGGDDGMLAIWYLSQSQTPLFKVAHDAPLLALAWSADNKLVATASGNNVTIWRLQ
ncbi:MAG: WD40 domain-containing protein [Ktedonobacteraceae bacterium]